MRALGREAKGGFTLIELLVVIAIIGILAAIAIPQVNAYRRRAYDTDVKSNIKSAITTQEAYFTDHLSYTSALGDLIAWGFKQSGAVDIGVTGSSTTFTVTGTATAGCSSGTGTWSFASTNGVTTGTACN